MTATKKPKSRSAANERARSLPVAQSPTPRREDPVQWHEQAAFHLTLDHAPDAGDATIWRTHVYHEESGEEQTQSGILQQDVIRWIRERAGAPSAAQEPIVAVAEAPELVGVTQSAASKTPTAEPCVNVDELAIEEIAT